MADDWIIDFPTLLDVFFTIHDPTTLNRQGADIGTQYRSVIFYHSQAQFDVAREVMAEMTKVWQVPLVTELVPLPVFYPAEDFHRDFYPLPACFSSKFRHFCPILHHCPGTFCHFAHCF